MAIKGGVVSLSIAWHCNLDYDFMSHCLPRYNFRILDDFGWNFRHAKYHEENRRTLYKMYGIKASGEGCKGASRFDACNVFGLFDPLPLVRIL